MTALALDTSVAVALVLTSHVAHADVRRQLAGRPVALTGHSLAETYSVLTRLPGDARLAPHDASRLLAAGFGEPALLSAEQTAALPSILAPLGIAGGAVYDALVALAAVAAGRTVVTRDHRAAATYAALSARVELIQ